MLPMIKVTATKTMRFMIGILNDAEFASAALIAGAMPALPALALHQLVGEGVGAEDFAQDFQHPARVDGDCAID